MAQKLKHSILVLFLAFCSLNVHSQGLNNNYKIDSTDLGNSLDLLGIEIYKFPIHTNDSSYLNLIIEEYRSDTLFSAYDHVSSLLDVPEKYLKDVSMITSSDTSWLRIYFYKKDNNTLIYRFTYNSLSIDFIIDDMTIMNEGTRAYDFETIEKDNGETILIWYGSEPSDQWRHCPSGMPLEEVIKKYDKVIAFKAQLLKME